MSTNESALVPTEVRSVDFYGDPITGAFVEYKGTTQIYVPLRPICTYLGLDWSGQRQRLMRDDVLADEVRIVVITPTNLQGGDPNVLCLPIEFLPGWLFGISATRAKESIREKLTQYRRECFRVLWNAFKPDMIGSTSLAHEGPTERSNAQLAYELATAVQHLARQQLDFEQRLDNSARWARSINDRVTQLELRVSSEEEISEAQAIEIAGAVKMVAQALDAHGTTNSYQRVYGELYRRFGITSYKSMPQRRFTEALGWLRTWYTEVSEPKKGTSAPDTSE